MDWLLKYNDVKIITRDRASSYAAAIIEVCPNAIQMADLFHLFMNLSDALDAYFKSISKRIRTLIADKTNKILELAEKKSIGGRLINQVYQFSRMYWKSFRQQNLPLQSNIPKWSPKSFPILKVAPCGNLAKIIRGFCNSI